MQNNLVATIFIFLNILTIMGCSKAVLLPDWTLYNDSSLPGCVTSEDDPGAQAVYVGVTSLPCLLVNENILPLFRRKRYRIRRDVIRQLTPVHSWVMYNDTVFEFGIKLDSDVLGPAITNRRPSYAGVCQHRRKPQPVAYSVLSQECIKNCTENFSSVHGQYHFYVNNCHRFTNMITDILCKKTTCPDWCSKEVSK